MHPKALVQNTHITASQIKKQSFLFCGQITFKTCNANLIYMHHEKIKTTI